MSLPTLTTSIPVPVSGFGTPASIGSLVGPLTFILTGTFKGTYAVYGSHDGVRYAPLFQFDSGGVEGIRHTFEGSLNWVAIKCMAEDASGVTASVSGESVPGALNFAGLGTLQPGTTGPQPAVNLGVSGYQAGLNFILTGGLEGKAVIEGSSDAVRWNPIGQFSADPTGPSLLGTSTVPEFSPLVATDLVRYVRVNILGRIVSTVVVTVGGANSTGGGTVETLSVTYQAGFSAANQTITLSDSKGGKINIVTSNPSFTDPEALEVLTYGGVGAAFMTTGGMILGPVSIAIGTPASFPDLNGSHLIGVGEGLRIGAVATPHTYSTAIGLSVTIDANAALGIGRSLAVGGESDVVVGAACDTFAGGLGNVVVGTGCRAGLIAFVSRAVAIGHTVLVTANNTIAIGSAAQASGEHGIAIGSSAGATGAGAIAIGYGASAAAHQVVFGAPANGYSLFEVVSSLAGTPDLFKFDSTLGSNGDTDFFLLCKATTSGAVALQQVTLAAPAGGYSALRVANA